MRDGCAHMKQAFDIESINLDDLISTAMDDPKAAGADIQAFHGVNFADLNTAYHQFCKNEPIVDPVVDIGQVIDFFNTAAADLPDPNVLKGKKLPSLSAVLDGSGQNFADVFQPGNRRIWVSLVRCARLRAEGFHRGGGPALLRASRRRRARHHPRLHRRHGRRRGGRRAVLRLRNRW